MCLNLCDSLKLKKVPLLILRNLIDDNATRFVDVTNTCEQCLTIVSDSKILNDGLSGIRITWCLVDVDLGIITDCEELVLSTRNIDGRGDFKLLLDEIVVHKSATVVLLVLLDEVELVDFTLQGGRDQTAVILEPVDRGDLATVSTAKEVTWTIILGIEVEDLSLLTVSTCNQMTTIRELKLSALLHWEVPAEDQRLGKDVHLSNLIVERHDQVET